MNRVLIVRIGSLGDLVHAIPVAAALRRAFPGIVIDWLVAAKHRPLLDLVPVIDQRLTIGDAPLPDLIRRLRRARYDVALDLQGLLKSAVLARASGARRVVGFGTRDLREPFARLFYTETRDTAGRSPGRPPHVIVQNLALLESLGVPLGEPEFPIDVGDSPVARRVADETGGRYALLNPGAAWPNKRWPPERFAAVATALGDRHGLTSIVLWGPGEEPLARQVAAGAGGAARVSPATTIADLLALSRGASLMVSGDTGPAHLAAAVGAPIVGLYGPTLPERNGPWSSGDVTVSRADVCRCHLRRRCHLPIMCLLDIHVDDVLAAAERRLRTGREAPSDARQSR